ncbi:transcriptional regulator, winged helix family [Kribbella flavida DSM 17836]|uniref:Transcriptional regulator, winged helix family n=1 Tax=Kribbella flavida (strain DSM 17836 / JCM 10339 / NBRC 14399) TaxID=479435 RepID=D2Q2F2_KRIFD|nr:BTAD domain-containing putative transcriptional regulator [Kribbella flavida]ADB35848.1 transcriptional regulator, winged helix family [Kribbella flavida DSM 17836]
MRIAVLGPLAMWAADGTPLDVRGVRLRGLLARLALGAGRPVGVDTLVDGLWGSEAPSANALQSLVSRLRASLPVTESSISVQSGPAGYTLTIEADSVDAVRFEQLARRGRQLLATDPAQARDLLTQAHRLWRGEALADLRDLPFAEAEADRLGELRLAAAEDLAEAAITTGHAREVVAELERLTLGHPLRERAHELLIRALAADGRQAEALAAYERVRTTLVDDLGADPGRRLQDVHVAVLRGDAIDPPPAVAAVPRPVAAAPKSNLRMPLTSFVGRAEDVAELTRQLADGARLVTMVGPGGAGKTRLATETGRTLVEHSGDGIWLVELAPLAEAADVAPAVLSTLGASEFVDTLQTTLTPQRFPTHRAATERLVEVIADRRILLVLDNCEHLVQEVARLVDSLLAECPRLRVLTTSREPLGIPGEHLHQVGPLALPPVDATDDDYPSIRLFVDRARAVRPDFAVSDANREAIAEICRRLDGMPLAIELAAARLRALTPQQIVERLADRFRLLTSGSRTALPRHQTLRAVVEWSWELLEPEEQAVARRLSLFSGGATLEAAEQICSDSDLPPEAVLGVLASLVDKSLVDAAADDRSVRYRMLETVKAYGAEQLAAAGEVDRFRQAHTAYFGDLLRQARPKLRTGDQLQWIARLDADSENLLDALRHSVDSGQATNSLELVASLGEYWTMRGQPAEAVAWFEAALAVPGPTPPLTRATAVMLYAFGTLGDGVEGSNSITGAIRALAEVRLLNRRHPEVLESGVGRFTNAAWAAIRRDAAGAFRELDEARSHPDPWTRNMAVMMSAMFRENEGDLEQMAADLAVALDGFRAIGDRWGTALALRGLATQQAAHGEHQAALDSLTEALRLIGELGTPEGVPQLLGQAAFSRFEVGDAEGAKADMLHALQLAGETGGRSGQAMITMGLATLARRTGELDEALELAERAATMLDLQAERIAPAGGAAGVEVVAAHGQAMVMAELSRVMVARGDLPAARRWIAPAVGFALNTDDVPVTAGVVEAAAAVDLLAGDAELSARTLGLAAALRGARTVPDSDVRATLAAAQAQLGEARFQAAYQAAARIGHHDAFAELRKRFSSSSG